MNQNQPSSRRQFTHFYAIPVLLLLLALGASPGTAQAQWTTNGNNINNTNTGNVGIGTTDPAGKLEVRIGSIGGWDRLVVNTTSLWGDGSSQYVTIGAGGAAGIMISNPHVPWYPATNSAVLRMGRSGGVSTGAIYDIGTGTGDSFFIAKNGGQASAQFLINSAGYIGINNPTPYGGLDVAGYGANSWLYFRGNAGGVNPSSNVNIGLMTAWNPSGGQGETQLLYGAGPGTNPRLDIGSWNGSTRSVALTVRGGNVGIGTTDPRSSLDVAGVGNIWSGGRFAVPNGFMAPGSLTIGNTATNFGGGSVWNASTAGLMLETADNTEVAVHDSGQRLASLLYYEGGATNRLTLGRDMGWGTISAVAINGNVTVAGNINAKYQDVAEWVESSQKLEAGTVVALDPEKSNQVLASSEAYDTRVAGVVSAQPGITLGESGAGKVLVATTGRVKVKVDASRAPIKIGDLLVTSDVQGVAMKSEPVSVGGRRMHTPGTLIGKALEPLEKGTGEILVLLSLQ